jgi:hypothetical protein
VGGNETDKRQEHGSMTMMGSLRVIELQLVAFVLVFSTSGLVPLLDLLFPAFVSIYLFVDWDKHPSKLARRGGYHFKL